MKVQQHVSLAEFTTWQTGGDAAYFLSVQSEVEVVEAVQFATSQGLPLVVLGGGSNMLVSDTGFPGVVLHMVGAGVETHVQGEVVYLTATAGTNFDELVATTVAAGWWGLENLSYIPGSVGATPVQNVGAYGVEVSDCIEGVRVYDRETASFVDLTQIDCQFAYRDSYFKQHPGRYVITAVTFRLSVVPQPKLDYQDLAQRCTVKQPTLSEIRSVIGAIRAQKFPDWKTVGTAGSFFKNPHITAQQYTELRERYPALPGFVQPDGTVKVALGWILDKVLDMKGRGTETVGCYHGQALVLYNKGGATTRDVLAFAETLTKRVYEVTGITITREVTLLPSTAERALAPGAPTE